MTARDESLSQSDFSRLCRLIYDRAGIALGPDKRIMVESRIKRRLHALGMDSYGRYCDFLFDPRSMREELEHLFNVVTTNKTDFFREPRHFDFLERQALPEFVTRQDGRPFTLWSAGCSSGEEPYTMAMVLSEFAATHAGFHFRILATDLSTNVLERAQRAVYTTETVAPIAPMLRQKYLLRSRDRSRNEVRITPELRQTIEFRRLNFMDDNYGLSEPVDGIFCRNVLIYFDRATQEAILGKLCRHLSPGGYLFVGHSETLHEMRLPVEPVAPALYRRTHAVR
jgi:chemotaxis protein methyltransferase CheR